MKIRIKRSTIRKVQRTAKQAQKSLVYFLRTAGRFLHTHSRALLQKLMRLPQRTLWIGIGSTCAVLIGVMVIALTLPKKQQAMSASADTLGALTAAEPEIMNYLGTTEEEPAQQAEPFEQNQGTGQRSAPEPSEEAASAAASTQPEQSVAEGTIDLSNFSTLEDGDDDPLVAKVQERLMELGYMDSDEPTEHFGPMTEHALKIFQAHNGLDDDGVCGVTTYTSLMSDSAKVYVMQLGDDGESVEAVQQRLYELGYITNKSNITGTFGEITQTAVMEFQDRNKLTDDGKVGDKTLEMLFSENPASKCFSIGDKDDIIKSVQKRLDRLGYYSGSASGEYTKATATAVKKFQSVNGLIVDGTLGPTTKDAILSDDAKSYVMQLGDSGSDVEKVQKRLAELNYIRSANATGYFGEITEQAVIAFQSRNKLHSDGKVGTGTYDALFSNSARKASSSSSSGSSSSGSGSSSGSSSSSSGSSSSSSGSSSSGSSSSSSSSSSSGSNSKGIEKLISIAEGKLGCKYVSGAKGSNSFDCSGFVYYCLRNSGVNVNYMTSIAWRSTNKFTRISSLKDCKRGDILVFSGSTMAKGHVGIYLGNGKMIDASSSAGRVRITSTVLSGKYWPSHFLMAYRVF